MLCLLLFLVTIQVALLKIKFTNPTSDDTEHFPPARLAESLQTFEQAEFCRVCANGLVLDGSKNSTVKHIFEVMLRQSRTLHIVVSSDPACQSSGLTVGHWFGSLLSQLNQNVHVVAKIRLSPNQNDGRGLISSTDLWDPFGGDVLKGDRVDQAEAQDEDIDVGIAQRAKMSELLLSHQINRKLRRKY